MKTIDRCELYDCLFCFEAIQEEEPYMYSESAAVCRNCIGLAEQARDEHFERVYENLAENQSRYAERQYEDLRSAGRA